MMGTPTLTRSQGVFVGGFNPGGGRTGFTAELDSLIVEAAELLRARYGRDVQIRFNSDRLSGGAFLQEIGGSVGITAQLYTLTRARQLVEKAAHCGYGKDTFEAQCKRWRIDPNGQESQISRNVFCDARFLRDPAIAELGNPEHRYSHVHVGDLPAALAWLDKNAVVPA